MEADLEVFQQLILTLNHLQCESIHFFHQLNVLLPQFMDVINVFIWTYQIVMFGLREFVLDCDQLRSLDDNTFWIFHRLQQTEAPERRHFQQLKIIKTMCSG